MNKKEYLEELKKELTLLNEEERKKTIRSYRVKINTMINRGMSESDTLRTLGTPHSLANKILKEKGIKVEKEKKVKKEKKTSNLKNTISLKLDEIKKNRNENKDKPIKEKKTDDSKKILKKEKKKSEDEVKVTETKETSKKEKNKAEKIVKEKLSKKENKKKVLKEEKDENKKEKVILEENIEEPQEEKKIIKNKKKKEKEILEQPVQEEVIIEKTSTLLIRDAMNLGCLIISLILLYFPFNLVNSYAMQIINKLELGLTIYYVTSLIVFVLYLIVCVTALVHYITYITNNKKSQKINILNNKFKKLILIILEIPMMLFVVFVATLFFMVCFLYLDGLKVIGLPIAFLGVLLFVLMVFIALRNKVKGIDRSLFYSFITYLLPLLIMAFGLGISYKDIMKFDYVHDVDQKYTYKLYEKEYSLPDEGNYRINFNTNYRTQYNLVEDKKLKNAVRIEITYYKDYYNLKTISDNSSVYISLNASARRKLSMFLENIKDNEIYSFSELERYEVTIYYNPKNADRIIVEN